MGSVLSLGLATTHFVTNEVVDASSEYRAMQANYSAEAGVERAMRELKDTWNSTQDWSGVLDGADNIDSTSDDGVLSFGSSASLKGGNYSVVITDNDDGDSNQFIDSDATVIITSVGTAEDGKTRTILSEVTARQINPSATIHGNGNIKIDMDDERISISGDDYNIGAILPTTVGVARAFTTGGTLENLKNEYLDNFTGLGYIDMPDPEPPYDVPSILGSAGNMDVEGMISEYSAFADQTVPEGDYNQSFETSTDYKIIYATGKIKLKGTNSSCGMLISDDKIEVRDKHTWTGILIARESIKFSGKIGEEDVTLYGASYLGNADLDPLADLLPVIVSL